MVHNRSIRGSNGDDVRVCVHCGRKGHEKEKCFELIGWPKWYTSARGGRGGRTGRRGARSGRGGRGVNGGCGGFAANVGSFRQGGAQDVTDADRSSAPTLTDDQ